MTSQIDVTKPVFGTPTTQSVRDNFTTASNEISDLQSRTTGSPFLPLAGGRMTGAMYLFNDPTDGMMPATKGYVDAQTGSAGAGIPEAPSDGATYGRNTGSWQPVLPIAGGTLSGPLILAANPTNVLGATTKQYVDALAATKLSDAPNDANTYGRGGAAWVGVLPIVGGLLTGSLGVGLPLPAALSTTSRHVIAGQFSGPVNYNGYQGTDGQQHYRTAGFAAAYSFYGNNAAIYCAPTGVADGVITWPIPLQFDAKGNLLMPNALAMPTDTITPTISANEMVLRISGHIAWNSYVPTPGTHWTYLANGFAGNIYQDGGAGAISITVTPSGSTGGTLPAGQSWTFNQNGQMVAPGLIWTTTGGFQVRTPSGNGFIGSYNTGAGVNWGFWTGGTAMYLGTADANNVPTVQYLAISTVSAQFQGDVFVGGQSQLGIAMNKSTGDRYYLMTSGYFFQWYVATGSCGYSLNNAILWYMRNDGVCFDGQSYVAGHGGYVDLSDRRAKANIKTSTYGLAELVRLEVVEFDRIPMPVEPQQEDGPPIPPRVPHHEIGFIAQDVQPIIPEAIRVVGMTLPDGKGALDDPDPSLGMSYQTVIAVAVNAIKEINARLVAKGI